MIREVQIRDEAELERFAEYLDRKGIKWNSGHDPRELGGFRTGCAFQIVGKRMSYCKSTGNELTLDAFFRSIDALTPKQERTDYVYAENLGQLHRLGEYFNRNRYRWVGLGEELIPGVGSFEVGNVFNASSKSVSWASAAYYRGAGIEVVPVDVYLKARGEWHPRSPTNAEDAWAQPTAKTGRWRGTGTVTADPPLTSKQRALRRITIEE